MSSDGAEWVIDPTARKSTPVSATARARSRVTPPDASVRARLPQAFTASAIVSSSMLSSSSRSQPRSRASATCSRVSTSTSRGSPGPAALAASTARRRLPAAWMWLSLTSRASYSPMRWLAPPPQRTAYFSRWRSPGVVLRVSRTTTPVPATASTKAAVSVATPERCPRKFSIVRSAASSTLAGPATCPSTAPASTGALSATSGRNAAGPSRSRSRTSASTTSTAGNPATTPGPRATSSASARAPSSRLVGSPSAPRSSSSATRTASVNAPAGNPTVIAGSPGPRAEHPRRWSPVHLLGRGDGKEAGVQAAVGRPGQGLADPPGLDRRWVVGPPMAAPRLLTPGRQLGHRPAQLDQVGHLEPLRPRVAQVDVEPFQLSHGHSQPLPRPHHPDPVGHDPPQPFPHHCRPPRPGFTLTHRCPIPRPGTRVIPTRRWRAPRWGSVAEPGNGLPRVVHSPRGHRPGAHSLGGQSPRARTCGASTCGGLDPEPLRIGGVGEGAADAGGEDDALEEGVGGEAVGAVDAGAGGFADGEQAGEAGAAVEVGEDAAHQVVGGR